MLGSYETAIGKVLLETNWDTARWFFERRQVRGRIVNDHPVLVQVNLVCEQQVEAVVAQGCQDESACPRTVQVQDAAFVVSRNSIVGFIPDITHLGGVFLEWLWYALPIFCAPEGWQTVHASVIETEHGAVLICGGSGSGKTTLLLRLLEAGRGRLFTEDIALINSDRGVVRAWDRSLHLHPHQVPAGVDPGPTLDFCGKIRWKGCRMSEEIELPIWRVFFLSEKPVGLGHSGDGFDSEWIPKCGADAFLAARAEYVGYRPDPASIGERRPPRVLLVNRDPSRPPTAWDGVDMTNVYGYREGLRKAGWIAHFQPSWIHHVAGWDLVHLFHTQFPWMHEIVPYLPEETPVVVTAITHGSPELEQIAPVVRRAQRILCYSQTEIDFYRECFPELGDTRFGISPQGVPASLYDFAEAVEPEHRVFMAARYTGPKNQTMVLKACKQLDVPITFAGPENADDSAQILAHLHEIAGDWKGATFLPMLHGADLWREYRRAWVHANASGFEPFGLNSLEALACGCNIIHTEEGWASEHFAQFGGLCSPFDLDSISQAIENGLNRPRGWHGYRPQTWDEASCQLLPIYQAVGNGRQGVPGK
jgi:glycosyltransferase involved in cell wall biosynthesis